MVLEKVEILDESTGQIILRERVVYHKPAASDGQMTSGHSDMCLLDSDADSSPSKQQTNEAAAPSDTGQCQIAFVSAQA